MKTTFTLLLLLLGIIANAQSLDDKVQIINNLIEEENYSLALKLTNELIEEEDQEYAALYVLKSQGLLAGKNQIIHNEELYKKTLEALDKALEIDPEYTLAYLNRAHLNLINRRFPQAIEDFTSFIELSEDEDLIKSAYKDRATAKFYTRDFEGAITDYTITIELDPNNIGTILNLSAIYTEVGEFKKAKELLIRGLENNPNDISLMHNLGYLYLNTEDYKKAISYFDKVIKEDEQHYLAFANRGFSNLQLNNFEESKSDLERSIELYPDNSYVYMYSAKYYIKQNKIQKACERLHTANAYGFTTVYGEEVNQLIQKHCD